MPNDGVSFDQMTPNPKNGQMTSSSSQNLSIKTQNSSKRNIEELNLETNDDNVGKRNKTR
ncbi:hypothetical protein GLOIN_2v1792330 [Rhizophagus irregularis DAOM 181602=DAOM 197198]|uniref:Uncharacterized protein n=1 Tax=Rhizophagus irregularis (strain DAOM 181602 / DAOM 197198 / MUCL 43194) TaxID=747089 RepID=A0A2P4NK26_RHIID|nr:hypothetical protein GLOIN_2v1792330 [Rhizophagus irregularis DAOM 181602=DAOM 197198]POG53479.1 hypothetical protein GLOIN_2v1792330 [Rhizophagus irregularis DAOM 181602=DAOM 197198]|eukprot:XP_025164086.1 hypothetical protein GLOIN_2v1792330 [Rhizophagus irregularis DAOM 181602=DAOM 197198]